MLLRKDNFVVLFYHNHWVTPLRRLSISYSQIAGIQLTVNGVTYPNNSIVTNTDIGTGSAALLCTTNYPPCCSSAFPVTQWYFPNESQVPNNRNLPYQRTRGQNPGRVNLNRNSESSITGIFHCDIFDAYGTIRSLYVGIYNATTGESCTLSGYLHYQSWVLCVLHIFMTHLMQVESEWHPRVPGKGTLESWCFGILG